MNTELPSTWSSARLSELSTVRYGKGLPVAERVAEGFPYVASGGTVAYAAAPICGEDVVVIGRKGNAGSIQAVRGGCWPSDTTFYVTLPRGVSLNFLALQLEGLELRQHEQSTAVPGLSRGELEQVEVRIAPEAEQRRIVEELERRFSHLDSAEAGIRAAIRLTAMARSSALRAGTRGDMALPGNDSAKALCAENDVPFETDLEHPDVVWVRLGDIAVVGSGTTPARGNERFWKDGDVPWVTSGQISAGVITEPSELVTQIAVKETSLKLWPAGTLLMAMYGEGQTRGRCADLRIDSTCNQACAAIRLGAEFQAFRRFLLLYLQGRYDENRRLGAGGVQDNLNLGLVKEIWVPLPGPSTQAEWVAETERRLSLIDAAQRTAEASLAKLAQIRRSLLLAAFSGQLVPRDPDDEPAKVLLERIRAERAAAAPQKKTRAKRKKKEAAA